MSKDSFEKSIDKVLQSIINQNKGVSLLYYRNLLAGALKQQKALEKSIAEYREKLVKLGFYDTVEKSDKNPQV